MANPSLPRRAAEHRDGVSDGKQCDQTIKRLSRVACPPYPTTSHASLKATHPPRHPKSISAEATAA